MRPTILRIETPAGDIRITVELVGKAPAEPAPIPDATATLVSKGHLAAIFGRSNSAISNWIKSGRISPAAIVGEGQRAKIWVEQVQRDLAARPYPQPATYLGKPSAALVTKRCAQCDEEFTGQPNRKLCGRRECQRLWQKHLGRTWQLEHPEKLLENYRKTASAKARARTTMRLGKGETK